MSFRCRECEYNEKTDTFIPCDRHAKKPLRPAKDADARTANAGAGRKASTVCGRACGNGTAHRRARGR